VDVLAAVVVLDPAGLVGDSGDRPQEETPAAQNHIEEGISGDSALEPIQSDTQSLRDLRHCSEAQVCLLATVAHRLV
jgi:hypothetical protein